MRKKILVISIISTITLVLVSIAPSINANVETLSLETLSLKTSEEEDATPIVLVLQLITKLHNHKEMLELEANIDYVDNVQDEILRIIESDEELNSIIEQLSVEDCGCEDDSISLEWKFPVICVLLLPITWLALYLYFVGGFSWLAEIVGFIGYTLDCFWFF